MPIPLLVGAAILLGGEGLRRGARSVKRNNVAKAVNQLAQRICDDAKEEVHRTRRISYSALESLGRLKLVILDKSFNRFVEVFSRISKYNFDNNTAGLNELGKFKLDPRSLQEMRELGGVAASLFSGVAGGGTAGALAAFGAFNATMALGSASTGAAIASLSGVAATNATLAFLGGGTLAAGGFGVAGGMIVLGGVVAGPALAVLGFMLDANAGKNLENAYSNLAEARKIAEECKLAITMCKGIEERAVMFTKLLQVLDGKFFQPLIEQMENIVRLKGTDVGSYATDDINKIAMAEAVALTIKKGLDTPILTNDGRPSDEAMTSAGELGDFIKALPDPDSIN